jgi:protein SCO1/2
MRKILILRIATVALVLIGAGLVWLSWQVRLSHDEAANAMQAIPAPPPSGSAIGKAFQDDGHGMEHGGDHGDAHQTMTAPSVAPPGGNVYALGGEWRDQDGTALALSDLSGKPIVYSFIYTACEDACPLIVQSMQAGLEKVPSELRNRAHWVLFSFDPERDPPEALKAYRGTMGLHESNWRLLTAPENTVHPVAEMSGFRYSRMGEHFSHNAVIAVADANGDMVGWFADERITDAELLGRGLTQALGM